MLITFIAGNFCPDVFLAGNQYDQLENFFSAPQPTIISSYGSLGDEFLPFPPNNSSQLGVLPSFCENSLMSSSLIPQGPEYWNTLVAGLHSRLWNLPSSKRDRIVTNLLQLLCPPQSSETTRFEALQHSDTDIASKVKNSRPIDASSKPFFGPTRGPILSVLVNKGLVVRRWLAACMDLKLEPTFFLLKH
jgi:hypothetical protein